LLGAACPVDYDGDELLTLRDVLQATRALYEQIQRANQKRKETLERKRAELHADPAVAREALRRGELLNRVNVEWLPDAAKSDAHAHDALPRPRRSRPAQAAIPTLLSSASTPAHRSTRG
jgi:hypothetical protein